MVRHAERRDHTRHCRSSFAHSFAATAKPSWFPVGLLFCFDLPPKPAIITPAGAVRACCRVSSVVNSGWGNRIIGAVHEYLSRVCARMNSRAFAAIAGAIIGLFLTGIAAAQDFASPDPDQPVTLIADGIRFDADQKTVTAQGNVEVYYGDRTLTADEIVYNDDTGRISASGDIVLRDPTGTTVFADTAELDAQLTDGIVEGARSFLAGNARLAAVEAQRVDERYNTLSKVVYSPCNVCADDPTPLWRIRARRVIHDEEERVIHYENATLDVFGVPVLWTPYFRHPDPTVDRASGFLAPSFLNDSVYGFGVKLPYYFVIDDQSDFTLTPFVTTKEGPILEGEYRRVFESGSMTLAGSITDTKYSEDGKIQGHLDTEGRFRFIDDFDIGWDVKVASDDGYLRRFDFSDEDRLTSEVYVERYNRNGFFDAAGVYFQSLRFREPAGNIPLALPVFDARWDNIGNVLGGDANLFASGYTLVRDVGRDASRLTLGADWERTAVLPSGLSLTGFAEVRGDLFNVVDDAVVGNETKLRASGLMGLEARYPLLWDGVGTDLHIIEPVVQFIAAPYGGNGVDVPNEDSLLTEFDETNVLDRNHFAGLDLVEEGPRINVALRYQGEIGQDFRLDASVGQVFRFEDISGFSNNSGLSDNASDLVTFWQASYNPYVTLTHRMRITTDGSVARNEIGGRFRIDPVTFGVSYSFFEADPAVNALLDRQELISSVAAQLDENWFFSAYAQQDLEINEFVNAGGTLTYRNECCEIEMFVRQDLTDSIGAPSSTSVGVNIKLVTLGD